MPATIADSDFMKCWQQQGATGPIANASGNIQWYNLLGPFHA